MRSRETYHLQQSAREIRVALVTDGDRVGGLLNEQHPLPVGEGEPAFDYRLHIEHLVAQLDSAGDDAVVAEDQHSRQQIRVSRSKLERDDVAKDGYGQLVAARGGLESLYERGGFELAFVSGKTPTVPDQLQEQLGQTVKLLQQPAVEPGELRAQGFSADFGEVADGLESRRLELRDAIDGLDAERKVAEGTLVAKQKAIDVLRRTVLWVGRTAEGLFHLAGEEELADRIRTSTRRPPRPSEQAAEEPNAEEAGSSDEPAPEAEASATPTES